MKKCKFVSLILAAATLFSLSACGGKKESGPKGEITVDGAVYKREVGESMFWEKEDFVQKDTVIPDLSINIYNYCPSIVQTDENTRYAYFCSNKYTVGKHLGEGFMDEDGDDQITDYIALKKGIKHEGEWYWGEKKYVVKPSKNSETEGEQTCDPNVVKGNFAYEGTTYTYLMAYLACNTRNNHYNHVCFAVANDPMGPWKKCSKINPFHRYTTEAYTSPTGQEIPAVADELMGSYLWGYGQASMISVDKAGRVQMFYTAIKPFYKPATNSWQHLTVTIVERWDLSNLNAPVLEYQIENMNCLGVKRDGEQVPTVTNADYAYDPVKNRIYASFDGGMVAYIPNASKSDTPEVGDVFIDYLNDYRGANNQTPQEYRWTTFGAVKPADSTHYHSVHNTAVIRDAYGWLTGFDKLETAVTGVVSSAKLAEVYPDATGHNANTLWSYRILHHYFDMSQ